MKTADDIFSSELDNRGINYSVKIERLYEIQIHSQTLTINLENIRRNYERDHDAIMLPIVLNADRNPAIKRASSIDTASDRSSEKHPLRGRK
jgi:hypothetical protein